jgi:hypothetical protein
MSTPREILAKYLGTTPLEEPHIMNLAELIAKLQEMLDKHGDCEVWVDTRVRGLIGQTDWVGVGDPHGRPYVTILVV